MVMRITVFRLGRLIELVVHVVGVSRRRWWGWLLLAWLWQWGLLAVLVVGVAAGRAGVAPCREVVRVLGLDVGERLMRLLVVDGLVELGCWSLNGLLLAKDVGVGILSTGGVGLSG